MGEKFNSTGNNLQQEIAENQCPDADEVLRRNSIESKSQQGQPWKQSPASRKIVPVHSEAVHVSRTRQ